MKAIYLFWLCISGLLGIGTAHAQRIFLYGNSQAPCAGEVYAITFGTSGTFAAGNTFRVQLSSTGSGGYVDLPGSFTSSPASVTLPAATTSSYYTYRIVADKPLVFSSESSSFRIGSRPSVQLTGSSVGDVPQNPYATANLRMRLSGLGTFTITMQDSARFIKHDEYAYDSDFPVYPDKTTTYRVASVRNGCGFGSASGNVTIPINSVGFRLIRTANNVCLGAQLPVYFSTSNPLPPNTTFEAELISTNDNNRSIALTVSGNTSPLLVNLPAQLPSTTSWGYRLRIYSKGSNVSAWYGDGTFTIDTAPRLSLTAASPSVPFGGQASLMLSYTASASGEVLLSDGRQVTLHGSGSSGTINSFTAVVGETTSYSIVSYTGACSAAVVYGSRTAKVQVRPGLRIDSLSTDNICTGQPITIYYTTTPGYTLPPQLRVQYGGVFRAEARITQPGQLVFTPPVSSTPVQSQVLVLKDARTDTVFFQANVPLLLRSRPYIYFRATQYTMATPGRYSLEIAMVANGPTSLTLNTGDRFTIAGGNANYFLPVYVTRTTTFSVVSAVNECGTITNDWQRVTITVQNPLPQPTGIVINGTEMGGYDTCPGSNQRVNLLTTGTFNADNQFLLEVTTPSGIYSGSSVQSFTKAEDVSFIMPTAPGTYRVRVSSTSPLTRSNELSYTVNEVPKASMSLTLPNTSAYFQSLTTVAGQWVSVFASFYGGRGPYRYELSNGVKGQSSGGFQAAYQPTITTNFNVVRLTDACGTPATIIGGGGTVNVVPSIIRTEAIDSEYGSVCVQTPVRIPFLQLGSVPANMSYVVQFSEDQIRWLTVPTSGSASPLLATLPASMANQRLYYRVASLLNGTLTGHLPHPITVQVRSVPNTLLTTPEGTTLVTVERFSGVSVVLRLIDASGDARVVLSNGATIQQVSASASGNSVFVSQPGSYSILSVHNGCGYGTARGLVRVIEKPYMALAKVSRVSSCVGRPVSFSYAIGGELEAGNKLAVYLVSNYTSTRSLLAEPTSVSGTYSFSLSTGLRPGPYSIQIETSAPKTTLSVGQLEVETPISATLLSGANVVYQNDVHMLRIVLPYNSSLYKPDLILSTPVGETAITISSDVTYLPVTITQSGSYSIALVINTCGLGTVTGIHSFTTLPPSSVTIRTSDYGRTYCTRQKYIVSLTTTGTFNPDNVMTAYLSDPEGTNVRPLPTVSGPSYLTITIPPDLPVGDRYMLRIGSSSPQHLGMSTFLLNSIRQTSTGTLTGNTSIVKGGSATISVALTGTPPWQLTLTDLFGPRRFTANTSPFTLAVQPDTTIGYRLTDVRNYECGVGTATGTALITVSRLLATEPALPLQVRAWPNPTAGWLQIEGDLPGRGEVTFELHTVAGSRVHQSVGEVQRGQLRHRIDLSRQPAGMYILTARRAGQQTQFRVLKE